MLKRNTTSKKVTLVKEVNVYSDQMPGKPQELQKVL